MERKLQAEAVGYLCSGSDNKPTDLPLDGLPFVYETVRITDTQRADCFSSIFERVRCQMVEISAEDHDAYVAGAEFVTHFDWSPFRQKFTFGYASLQQI